MREVCGLRSLVLRRMLHDADLLANLEGGGLGGGEGELECSTGAVDPDQGRVVVAGDLKDGTGKVLAVGKDLFWRTLVYYLSFFEIDNGVGQSKDLREVVADQQRSEVIVFLDLYQVVL